MFWKKGLLGVIVLALLVVVGRQVAADATDAKTSDKESVRRAKISDRQMEYWLERMAADESEARKDKYLDAGPERRAKVVVGSNVNAMVTIDLIPNGGAGNQIDDGITTGTVSGQGTKIAVEVFAKGVTSSLVGVRIEFEFDASVLTLDKVENSAFAFAIPEATGVNFAATAPVTLPASGFIGRAEFSTVVDVTGREFFIGIKSVTLAESAASSDVIVPEMMAMMSTINFNAAPSPSPSSPDFDGDGTVGIPDFLEFVNHFGTSRGDAGYDAKYDLDSNGAIGIPDFLIFVDSFGKPAPLVIPDANLRAVIETALGKASGASITRAEMATLTRLDAPNKGIRSLTGLEHATNLTLLNLDANSISDITLLSNLTNLTSLNLGGEWVDGRWANNNISDISALANLTNLTFLLLDNNSISDISALSSLTNLTRLDLDSNSISDISALSSLTNLTRLDLDSNSISDISALSSLTNLTRLLDLQSNSISDISALANLTNLEWLWLSNNSISDISVLANLTNLTSLSFWNNSISDISVLANLTNLTDLGLGQDDSISDISVLANLTNLTSLNIWDTSISDISVLANLTNLTLLDLDSNSISDISALSNLTNLEWLWLSNNSISDLAPLVANTGLGSGDYVDVRYNPLSATSINTHIPALQRRGVEVQFGSSKPAVVEKETRMPRAAMKRLEGEEWEDAGDRKWMEIRQDMISQKARRESK